MGKVKKCIERSVIDVQAEGYSQYMAEPDRSKEDFTAGVEWLADIMGIEIVENV